ncbi:MAG: hypothetical protein LBI14_00910 [Treponema sp.]|jgi:hypothetical protein|nr:hypothetical protein [Treponema sp.]
MKINPYRFRKVEEWKSALMLLPDTSFFDLLRSIFGNIKTPFNKQRLMEDLYIFLSRDDIRNTISAYIDEEDQKIIAAVSLLEDPPPEELEDFFRGSMSLAVLRNQLNNLEERLILYRFKDEPKNSREPSIRRFALNPVLEPILAPLAAEWGLLFPSEILPSGGSENLTTIDDRTLAALFAFISGEEEFYKALGIRKKVIEQAKRLFPDIDLEAITGSLRQLGLFTLQGEKLILMEKRIRDFANLSSLERREYWATGFYYNMIPNAPEYSRSHIHHIAAMIHRLGNALDPEKQYPEMFFHRCLMLFEKESSRSVWGWQFEKIERKIIINAMEMTGILKRTGTGNSLGTFWKIIPLSVAENSGPAIAMDSSFSFVLYPGISFADAMSLSAFCSVKEDSPFTFELSRASVVRGFDRGISAETMTKVFKDLTDNRIDESLEWTLKDWESRYAAVSLNEGLILGLSEDRQYLAETRPIASLISKTLGPGLYLLSGERQEIVAALQKAGVDIIAQPNVQDTEFEGRGTFASLGGIRKEAFDFNSTSSLSSSSKPIQEKFKEHLKKLTLPKAEIDELSARIERRLILTNNQLEKASIKFEKLEARGIDYQGKTAIEKQAIADGSMLEVTWPNPETGISVNIGYPEALEKKEGESYLILKSDSDLLRIPLSKISLLKRLKQSIFGA